MAATPLPPPTVDAPLLAWLLEIQQPTSRTRVKDWLRSGRIAVNGVRTTRHDHPLHPGDRVTIDHGRVLPTSQAIASGGIKYVYEDDAVLVIDKPAGLLSVATDSEKQDTAFVRVKTELASRKADRPFVVHRLDRETSGLLLFARSVEVRDRLQVDWPKVKKTYLAITEGTPRPPEGVIDNFLIEGRNLRVRIGRSGTDAKRAISRYQLVSEHGRYALVEVTLETGRKHQIRVHLSGLGCPVIGDAVYGAATDPVGRLGLHAWRLAFDHPVNGRRVELESPLPRAVGRLVG